CEGHPLSRKSLELVFQSERPPWMGCPEQIGTGEPLALRLFSECKLARHFSRQERNVHIPLGELHASEDVVYEFLIDRDAIAPRVRRVEVVEELIEAGHVGGLESLVRNKRPLQGPEYRPANCRRWKRV